MSDNKNIYTKQIINEKITLKFSDVNSDLENIILEKIKIKIEGKCINHGYVKTNSVKLLTYSCGELFSDSIIFDLVIECLISCPFESMILKCKVVSSTKVGLKCKINYDDVDYDYDNINPYLIFVARDHNYNNTKFTNINVEDIIYVRVIGHRFELNDTFISVIAELVEENYKKSQINKISKTKYSTTKKKS
tara:strand:- start:18 stop:593 length:576 start_codon:yes stop_codon:yes gene_type:complete